MKTNDVIDAITFLHLSFFLQVLGGFSMFCDFLFMITEDNIKKSKLKIAFLSNNVFKLCSSGADKKSCLRKTVFVTSKIHWAGHKVPALFHCDASTCR